MSSLLRNVHTMYDMWTSSLDKRSPDSVYLFQVMEALKQVLFMQGFANFSCYPGPTHQARLQAQLRHFYNTSVREELKSPRLARTIFYKAVRDLSVANFQQELLVILKPGLGYKTNDTVQSHPDVVRFKENEQKIYKEHARAQVASHLESTERSRITTCSNPGCSRTDNLKHCPCKKVAYCSRDCQVAHRKQHKSSCTFRKTETR